MLLATEDMTIRVMQTCGLLQGNPFSCGESQLLGNLLHRMWNDQLSHCRYQYGFSEQGAAKPASMGGECYVDDNSRTIGAREPMGRIRVEDVQLAIDVVGYISTVLKMGRATKKLRIISNSGIEGTIMAMQWDYDAETVTTAKPGIVVETPSANSTRPCQDPGGGQEGVIAEAYLGQHSDMAGRTYKSAKMQDERQKYTIVRLAKRRLGRMAGRIAYNMKVPATAAYAALTVQRDMGAESQSQ